MGMGGCGSAAARSSTIHPVSMSQEEDVQGAMYKPLMSKPDAASMGLSD